MSEQPVPEIVVRVFIPDLKANRCIAVQPSNKVLVAQNNILDRIAASVQDAQNYAFYLPPTSSSLKGTFLDEQLTFEDYTLLGHVPILEFRHISRDYGGTEGLTDRQVVKMAGKGNRKKFLDLVRAGQSKKVEKMLEQGLDPNFITEDGNTPLGMACGRGGKSEMILILVKGGAHLYFRGKDGLTPVHRASIGGNTEAIKTLLALGASPNYRDAKGLTPLYHTAVMGDDLSPCLTLLMHYSEINVRDANLYTELHQAAKFGNIGHIDLLIHYGADLSAANSLGNSPLHLAASQGRVKAVQLLLVRGADKMALNHQGNPPNQVAIICGHHNISSVIVNFSPESAEPFTTPPEYNVHSKYIPKGGKTSVSDLPFTSNGAPKSPPTPTMAAAMMQQAVHDGQTPPPGGAERGRTFSLPDVKPSPSLLSRRNTVDPSADIGPPPSPLKTPMPAPSGGLVRRFIVTEDYTPRRAGELLVKKGMTVEVLQTRHDGLCMVQSGSRKGWLHLKILREIPSGGGRPSPGVGRGMPVATSTSPPTATPTGPPMTQVTMPGGGIIRRPSFTAVGVAQGVARTVTVIHNNKGYGFAMRGVTATALARKTFRPTQQVPGLQYVAKVDAESSADEAGLKEGDFLLEINGQDVTVADHKEVVKVIRSAGGKPLVMKVMFPSQPTTNGNGDQAQDSLQSIPEGAVRSSELPSSNHSPALGNVGKGLSGTEQGEKARSRYDRSYLHERRLRQASESSASPSLQTTPTRQRVMSDSVAVGRESPPTAVRTNQAPVPPPRGDSPLLTYRSGSVSSLQSSQSSSSQQPPESSSTATPQPTESEEDVEEDQSTLAKELQTAIKKRQVKQRSQSVGVLKSEAEPNAHSMAGRERKMSAFESEVHQKVEERKSRAIEDKLRLTASKHSTVEPTTSVQNPLALGVPISPQHSMLAASSRDSVDILTKLMAVVGQVPDRERDSLEDGFRQSWASDDSSSRPVSAVASPYVSSTQLLPVKESQQTEDEEAAASQEDTQPAGPVESPSTLYTAPPLTAADPPTAAQPPLTTSAPSSITTAPSLNTTMPANNLTTAAPSPVITAPPATTAVSLPTTAAPPPTVATSPPTAAASPPTSAAPPPILPKPKWLKDGQPLKSTSTSSLHANPVGDNTRVRAASTSNLLAAMPEEPAVPASLQPASSSQVDIVPDQHGWFDVKSLLKSSAAKQPVPESKNLPTQTAVGQEEEVLSVSLNRRMHNAVAQPSVVVAAAFDDEDGNVADKEGDGETVSLDMAEKQHATVSFGDAANGGFDWNMWESSVTVAKGSQGMKGSVDDAEGDDNTAEGGWPTFYDNDPVMEAWGEDEVVQPEENKTERGEEEATLSKENHQEESDDESSFEMPAQVHDLPPPIINDNPPEGEGEVDMLDELEAVPPELLPPPLLDDEPEVEGERAPDHVFLPPPPLEIDGATLDESSTDRPLSILLPPPDIPNLIVEDFDSPGEPSLPVIDGDLGSESEDDSGLPSLPPPLADGILEAKAGGRLSILIDAPSGFQPLDVEPTSSTQQSDDESDTSDLPPPPPSSAPPPDSPSDTHLEFMLPPPMDSADNGFIAPVDIDVMAPPPPRFEADVVDDDVFASSGSHVELKDESKLPSTPPSLRAAFSRYSLALEAEKLGLPTLEPPVYSFKQKAVELWDVEDVCSWLKDIGLEKHLETFRENEIAGEHLVDMTKEDLKELGVKQFGHRIAITSKLQRLLRIQNESS